jgi:uncharacterized membrane protein (DUF485 family)
MQRSRFEPDRRQEREKNMSQAAYAKIGQSPKFQELVRQRSRLAIILSVTMLVIYFGFILLVAYAPGFLGTPISSAGVTTMGVPIGLFVIVSAFVLTGVYVAKANTTFDQMNEEILREFE